LSRRLSHVCVRTRPPRGVKPAESSLNQFEPVRCWEDYSDTRGNSTANTCVRPRLLRERREGRID